MSAFVELLAFLLGLGLGAFLMSRVRPARQVAAPLEVRCYVERRIADLENNLVEGYGFASHTRERRSELQMLQRLIEGEEDSIG